MLPCVLDNSLIARPVFEVLREPPFVGLGFHKFIRQNETLKMRQIWCNQRVFFSEIVGTFIYGIKGRGEGG